MNPKIKWEKVQGFGLGEYGELIYGEYVAHGRLGKWNIFVLAVSNAEDFSQWTLLSMLPGMGKPSGHVSEHDAKISASNKLNKWLKGAGL